MTTATQVWTKTAVSGQWACRGVGRVQTVVANRSQLTGRGVTLWVAFTEAGERIGTHHASRQQAIAAFAK